MSIFDQNTVKNHDEFFESQFATVMQKTPHYCIQHAYYGYCCEYILPKTDELKNVYGNKLVNLEIKICELFNIMTNEIIDENFLGMLKWRLDSFISHRCKSVQYKGMVFYQESFPVDKDIADIVHSYLLTMKGKYRHIRKWVDVLRYLKDRLYASLYADFAYGTQSYAEGAQSYAVGKI